MPALKIILHGERGGALETVLTVEELSKSFGEITAVDGLSFAVNRGEILGLLGPNGAGKTTAIRMIMGILRPDRGKITFHFNGHRTALNKGRIGYLPEERGLYDDARVLDTLVYLAALKGMPRREARRSALEWLARFELAPHAGKKLDKLSKGMQQKVQFIATILHRPEVVLLDEPFSGLDPLNQDLFKGFIRELQQGGTTVLLSAHQMNLVEELCENILMIHQGRPVLSGSLEAIKNRHGEQLVQLRFPAQEDYSFVHDLAGVAVVQAEPGRLALRYTGGARGINPLLQQLSARLTLEAITVQKPPLHDIFIQTVRKRGEPLAEEDPGPPGMG